MCVMSVVPRAAGGPMNYSFISFSACFEYTVKYKLHDLYTYGPCKIDKIESRTPTSFSYSIHKHIYQEQALRQPVYVYYM